MKFLRHWYLIFLLAVCSACVFKKNATAKLVEEAVYIYAKQEYSDTEFDHAFIENIDTVYLKGYINIMLNLLQEEMDVLYNNMDDAEFLDDMQAKKVLLEQIDVLTARTTYWQDLLQKEDLSDKRPLFYLVYARLTNATTQKEVVIPLTLDFQIKTLSLVDSLL